MNSYVGRFNYISYYLSFENNIQLRKRPKIFYCSYLSLLFVIDRRRRVLYTARILHSLQFSGATSERASEIAMKNTFPAGERIPIVATTFVRVYTLYYSKSNTHTRIYEMCVHIMFIVVYNNIAYVRKARGSFKAG